MTILGMAACSGPAPADTAAAQAVRERAYLLERVNDVAVVQVYADGFRGLPLNDETLIWHLSQAAIAWRVRACISTKWAGV